MIAGFDSMAKVIPPVSVNGVEVKHWTPDGFSLLRASLKGHHLREGHAYAQLLIDGDLWMSDTLDEMVANMPVIDAKGRVLIVGLGLGMALRRVLKNKTVTHVDCIERDKRVKEAVWSHVVGRDKRARCIIADARKWPSRAEQKYDFIWLDIWLGYPTAEEIRSIRKLYRPLLKRGGYIGQWERND